MRKLYQKPEVELISLITEEKITTTEGDSNGDGILDGETGMASSIF